jgi:phosphate transport system substrate-binding protein
MRTFNFLFIVVYLLIADSCKNQKKVDTETYTSGSITIAVDETFQPIINEEIDVFQALTPTAHIKVKYTNEVEAINSLLKGDVRMAIATRPLSIAEVKSLNSKKLYPRSIKLATDGVALIINNHNQDSVIAVSDLKKIMTGEVTRWTELFPKSKLGELKLVFDNSNSSTVRFAIDSICKGMALSKKLYAQNSNLAVIDYVSKTPNAIGVVGVNWLGNKKDSTNLSFKNDVRVMSVSKEWPAIAQYSYKPFQAYLFYGNYPLTRTLFVLLNDPKAALPTGLTTFLTGDKGQRIILKSALVPATQPVRVVHVNQE